MVSCPYCTYWVGSVERNASTKMWFQKQCRNHHIGKSDELAHSAIQIMHPRLPSVQTNFPLKYGGATSEQEHLTSEWDFLAKVTDEGGGEFPTRPSHVWLFRDKTEVARSLGLRHLFSFVMGTRKGPTQPRPPRHPTSRRRAAAPLSHPPAPVSPPRFSFEKCA